MIKLIPVEEKSKLKELCEENGVEYNKNIHAYISANVDLKALCIFSLDNYSVEILVVDSDSSDPLIPELLIRAVASYSANRSGYLVSVKKSVGENIDSTLKTLRFEKNENSYSNKVPNIMKGSCCKD